MAKKPKNEIMVGLTVFVVLVLTIWIIVVLGDWSNLLTAKQHVTVLLPYKVGLKGITQDSPIFLGGAKIGRVIEAGIYGKDGADAVADGDIHVFFTMELPKQYHLRDDCLLSPQSNVLGGQATLAIKNLGEKGKIIEDGQAVPLNFEGSIADAIDQVRGEMDPESQDSLLWTIKDIVNKIDRQVTVTELRDSLMGKLHEVMNNVNMQLDEENDQALIAKLHESLKKLDVTITEIKKLIENKRPAVAAAIDSAKTSLAEIEDLIANVKGPTQDTIASINETAKNIKDATPAILEKLEVSLTNADSAMVSAKSALDNADSLITGVKDTFTINRPNIDNILRNLDESSIHVKMLMRDIRNNPWRLRYPDDERKRAQGLVGAAGDFATGAERLETAASRLNALLGASDQVPEKKNRIQELLEELEQSFQDFQKVEENFWEKLK